MSLQNDALRELQAILVPSASLALQQEQQQQEQEHQANTREQPEEQGAGKEQEHTLPQQQKQEHHGESIISSSSNRPVSSSISTTNAAEFIPRLFYSLHQIRKDPNNSANQLETATGFIKHRLKSCKSLIVNNEDCKRLLGKTTEEWHEYIKNREKELQVKRKVLNDLSAKIRDLADPLPE